MDRRIKGLVALGLTVLVGGSTGCRSLRDRDEVPPGRRHQKQHTPGTPAVEFSTEPSQVPGMPSGGPIGGAMGNLGRTNEPPGGAGLAPYGAPSDHGYGAPGSSGALPGSATPSTLLPPTPPMTKVPDPDSLPPFNSPSPALGAPKTGGGGLGDLGNLPAPSAKP